MPDDLAYFPIDTPLGVFLVAERDGALKGGWFEGQKYFPAISPEAGWRKAATPLLHEAGRQLDAYFAGELTHLEMPLAPEGTAFQQQVWRALCAVPYGETTTYAALARAIGRPEAFHPVGAAVGRNPISFRALPPRAGQQRLADRLRGRAGPQALAARSRRTRAPLVRLSRE